MKIPVDKIREFISRPPTSDNIQESVLFARHDAAGLAFLIAGRHAIELAKEFSDEGSDGVFCEILGHIDTLLQTY